MSDWQLIENVPEGFFMRIGCGKWIIIKTDRAIRGLVNTAMLGARAQVIFPEDD